MKSPKARRWNAKRRCCRSAPRPRMNLVEVFFSIITRRAIRRGSFISVPDLITAIETFIDG